MHQGAIVHTMMMNVNPDTAGGLRERRRAMGLTQQQVANEAGCSLAYLQLLERGYVPDQSAVLARIETVLRDHEASG